MKKIWWLALLLLLSPLVLASEPYHLRLLAVQEENGTYIGSEADLFLELKPGSGRVFLDTFPFTKMDTQISTRFAKEIACNHFKLDCDKYDFIYTIKAKSSIIGGPSAGAAMAALTSIALLDLKHDEDITITGTINSGGIIGQVGGVKEKLQAAESLNLKKVLVSKGTTQFSEGNISLNLSEFAQNNLSLELVEVIDLDEVIFHLTGVDLNHKDLRIEENPEYKEIMKDLQNLLCERAEKIESELNKEKIDINESFGERLDGRKRTADNATIKEDYYSAASYCFGINIMLRTHFYQEKEASFSAVEKQFNDLEKKVFDLEKQINSREIETISDLQTLIVVKERLHDVRNQITNFREMDQEDLDNIYPLLGYAEERFFSAISWMQFFSMDGRKLVLDEEQLQQSCIQKISEADQRYQYTNIFIGEFNTAAIKGKLDSAKDALAEGEYELCLIEAIQAKGDSNAILSSMGLTENAFPDFLRSKINAVERVIAENSAEGTFPILAYSYYQYANSLMNQERYTSLIYLEYALEMGDLGIYFPKEEPLFSISKPVNLDWVEGFILGLIVAILVMQINPKKLKDYFKSLKK
jgi:uncharacterized protein